MVVTYILQSLIETGRGTSVQIKFITTCIYRIKEEIANNTKVDNNLGPAHMFFYNQLFGQAFGCLNLRTISSLKLLRKVLTN